MILLQTDLVTQVGTEYGKTLIQKAAEQSFTSFLLLGLFLIACALIVFLWKQERQTKEEYIISLKEEIKEHEREVSRLKELNSQQMMIGTVQELLKTQNVASKHGQGGPPNA